MPDQVYNSPVPPNWEELPKVTIVNHDHQSATFALLEKTGRLYYHLRYLREDPYTGKLDPNYWVSQVPIAPDDRKEITLIDGHDEKVRRRVAKYRTDSQAHQNRQRQAFWEIDRELSEEKRQKQMAMEDQWRKDNPPPPLPRFLNRRR
jgi:hypothetical protein